ncbi:MAG: nucleotidyltransferase domain-containing protein [Planctomycetes bacterium]|nr:nucleotidyltransferase domain-containing protein [Planctomycetota bacterium]
MAARIVINQNTIAEFCQRWGLSELALYGSVLRDDFGPDSDIDVLVSIAPDRSCTMFDLVRMAEELEGIFGRAVDIQTRRGIEQSRNEIRRQEILDSAEVIHAA